MERNIKAVVNDFLLYEDFNKETKPYQLEQYYIGLQEILATSIDINAVFIHTALGYLVTRKCNETFYTQETKLCNRFTNAGIFLDSLSKRTVPEELKDFEQALHELYEGSTISTNTIIETLEQNLETCEQWKKTRLILLSLCYCVNDDLLGLERSCKQIISNSNATSDMLLVVALLFELGSRLESFIVLKDAFLIISLNNVINPLLSEIPMIMVGKKLLSLHVLYQSSPDYRLFMEYVCRKISSCNIGTAKHALSFCSLYSQNVKDEIREKILDECTFTEDLKRTIDNSFKSKYFEEDLTRFLDGEGDQYLYRALNGVYCDKTESFENRAHKLALIYDASKQRSFTWDSNEEFILLCNCIHNFHVLLSDELIEECRFKAKSIMMPSSQIFSVSSYISMIERFINVLEGVRNPDMFPDFTRTFFSLLTNRYKNNLFKITKIKKEEKEQKHKLPLRKFTRPDRNVVRQDKDAVANLVSLALVEATKKKFCPLENVLYPKSIRNSNQTKISSLVLRIYNEEDLQRFLNLEKHHSNLSQSQVIGLFGLFDGNCEWVRVEDPHNMNDESSTDEDDDGYDSNYDDLDYDTEDLIE